MQKIKSLHQATMSFINGMPIGSPFTTKEFIGALQLFRAALQIQRQKNIRVPNIRQRQQYIESFTSSRYSRKNF